MGAAAERFSTQIQRKLNANNRFFAAEAIKIVYQQGIKSYNNLDSLSAYLIGRLFSWKGWLGNHESRN